MESLGRLAGLGAALCWAIGSVVFSRVPIPAGGINLFKNVAAGSLLFVTLAILAWSHEDSLIHASGDVMVLLAVSAVIGLVIGDTFYFRSLQILGPRRALVLTLFSVPLGSLSAGWLLGERLTVAMGVGIAVLLSGVLLVIRERAREAESAGHFPGSALAGVAYGLGGALCQALGGTWSKQAMNSPGESLDALEASFIRLTVAAAAGLAWAVIRRQLGSWVVCWFRTGLWKALIPASFCGTYLGIWFSLVAFKHTPVAVAATLTSMTPVFVLPIVWLVLRQRVSLRAVLGALVAILGVGLLFRW